MARLWTRSREGTASVISYDRARPGLGWGVMGFDYLLGGSKRNFRCITESLSFSSEATLR